MPRLRQYLVVHRAATGRGGGVALMAAGLLQQLPRLSEYDPGAVGEGSLDPLGLASVADQMADMLAPGVRARMHQPRFVTLSAIGAHACQSLRDVPSGDAQTTFDLAFEWLVVESLARYPRQDRLRGLPGSQKARRALALKQRLSASNYLAAPRVFGFTGVYRPFSIDAEVLSPDGLTSVQAGPLLIAWEGDQGLPGFFDGTPQSDGARLRHEIESACRDTMRAGQVIAPKQGQLMRKIADAIAPREAGVRERSVLRDRVLSGSHEVRNELTALMAGWPSDTEPTQREMAEHLAACCSPSARRVLDAVIAFEDCATVVDHAFRRMLAHATSLGGCFDVAQGSATPHMAGLPRRLPALVRRATDAAAAIDHAAATRVAACFTDLDACRTASDLVERLLGQHRRIQEAKGKRMWVDPVRERWFVRLPYRNQRLDLVDEVWSHPMRLDALLSFLKATS